MALTDSVIRSAKPRERDYKLADWGGLYLLVTPAGGKHWKLKFRISGKEKKLSLGSYPAVKLIDARKARDQARAQLEAGADPAHERKMENIASKIGAGKTFQSVAEDFIAVKLEGNGKAEATVNKARWFLSQLTSSIGSRPIAEIEPAELLAPLKKLERRGRRETAVRTRNFASRVFRHGVANTLCKSDPAALLAGALSTPIVKHHAAILDPLKLGEFLRAINGHTGATVRLAMQLSPHVFLRPGELRKGRWSEVDWENAVWTIPAERTKLRRNHSVPLSRQSLEILNELRQVSGSYELMFPGLRSHLVPMSENALNQAFRRMGWGAGEVTAHGLRATASTLLNECGKWHPDAIERALAHGHSNAVRGAYARGQHWGERVEMAQWWSDYLDQLSGGAKILPLARTG